MFSIQHWKLSLQTSIGHLLVLVLSGTIAIVGLLGTAYGAADSLAAFLGWTEADVKRIASTLIVISGAGATAASVALLFFVSGRTIWHYFSERRHLRCICCNYGDLQDVSSLADEAFGGEASNLPDIQRLWTIDQKCFWKVCRIKEGGIPHVAVGYFCVLRISANGAQSLLEGSFSGACPPTSHLETSRRRKCRHAYIGAVYGKNAFSKGIALAALTLYLDLLKPEKIYARGFSPEGNRLLRKNGFRPMSSERAAERGFFMRER
jgi:hypothetical protein